MLIMCVSNTMCIQCWQHYAWWKFVLDDHYAFFTMHSSTLMYAYNVCIKHNRFRSNSKAAKVISLPQGQRFTHINNYFPFFVFFCVSSLSGPLEKMHKHLLKYLERFNLIHTHQSGFRLQHQCHSALTCLVDRPLSSINDSRLNGVVFLV